MYKSIAAAIAASKGHYKFRTDVQRVACVIARSRGDWAQGDVKWLADQPFKVLALFGDEVRELGTEPGVSAVFDDCAVSFPLYYLTKEKAEYLKEDAEQIRLQGILDNTIKKLENDQHKLHDKQRRYEDFMLLKKEFEPSTEEKL